MSLATSRDKLKAYQTVRILMYYRRGYHERAKLLLQLAQSGHSIVDPKAARLKPQIANRITH